MAAWTSQRILLYTGLAVMLGFWAAALIGVLTAATLGSAYNASCTYQPPPLTAPTECGRLAAQIGQAWTVALLGGAVGFAGLILVFVGNRRKKSQTGDPDAAAR